MSNEAINWAFAQPIKHSTAKFVLVVMANHAPDGDWLAWPSVASLAEATGQDRKTVLENLKRLVAQGYLVDTGARKGATKQVPVYQLNRGVVPVTEQSQKRNDSENGTVPKSPSKSPVFPQEESQISVVTVPKTGHGITNEPPKEPSGNHQKKRAKVSPLVAAVDLPDWLPLDAWQGYLGMRQEKRKPPTDHAVKLLLADLAKWHGKGHDIAAALNASIRNGWTDVYEPKTPPAAQGAQLGTVTHLTKAGQATARNIEAWLEQKRQEKNHG